MRDNLFRVCPTTRRTLPILISSSTVHAYMIPRLDEVGEVVVYFELECGYTPQPQGLEGDPQGISLDLGSGDPQGNLPSIELPQELAK